jgi:SpoIID/LytB domain protein
MISRTLKTVVAAALVAAALPAGATAAERWSVKGAGWGHGIGMSQYGAYGFAKHGAAFRDILRHYYRGIELQGRGNQTIRVLLQANRPAISFRGASRAGGRDLDPDSTYKATRDGSTVVLRSASGRVLERASGLLQVTGAPRVKLLGFAANGVRDGVYRGALDVRTAAGAGLNAINALDLESYVRGVVPNESPSSWPAAALEAQAVAARSYALATNVGGRGFSQYADVRSQVYRGFLSETPSTAAAAWSTRGQVVTYGGSVVVTYFFSTSGGHTENVENVFTNGSPEPWLKGVDDPYDDSSPYHRWGPLSYSRKAFSARLGGWLKGRLKSFKVLERGVSPRVMRAQVRGSRGDTRVTGAQIRARLGLRDTWFYVRRVSARATAGAQARTTSGIRPLVALSGSVTGTRDPVADLQRKVDGKWVAVAQVPLERHGESSRYRIHVAKPGYYRVLAGWAPGPALRVDP